MQTFENTMLAGYLVLNGNGFQVICQNVVSSRSWYFTKKCFSLTI